MAVDRAVVRSLDSTLGSQYYSLLAENDTSLAALLAEDPRTREHRQVLTAKLDRLKQAKDLLTYNF